MRNDFSFPDDGRNRIEKSGVRKDRRKKETRPMEDDDGTRRGAGQKDRRQHKNYRDLLYGADDDEGLIRLIGLALHAQTPRTVLQRQQPHRNSVRKRPELRHIRRSAARQIAAPNPQPLQPAYTAGSLSNAGTNTEFTSAQWQMSAEPPKTLTPAGRSRR